MVNDQCFYFNKFSVTHVFSTRRSGVQTSPLDTRISVTLWKSEAFQVKNSSLHACKRYCNSYIIVKLEEYYSIQKSSPLGFCLLEMTKLEVLYEQYPFIALFSAHFSVLKASICCFQHLFLFYFQTLKPIRLYYTTM